MKISKSVYWIFCFCLVWVIGIRLVIAHEEEEEHPLNASGIVWVANGLDDSLSVIDMFTGEVFKTISVGTNPHILTLSPDETILYVVLSGQHDREPGTHGVTASDDDHHASSEIGESDVSDNDPASNSLLALDAQTGEVIARVGVGIGPTHPIVSSDGQRVYVTNTDSDSVSVIDTQTWEVIDTFDEIMEPHDGALTPDGSLLYLATAANNTMTVIDTQTGLPQHTFDVGNKPRGIATVGENGEIALVTNKDDGTISVIDVLGAETLNTYSVGDGAHAIRVSDSGSTAYVALSGENSVIAVAIETGEILQEIEVGQTPEQIDLSQDGRLLFVSNNADATVSIIDLDAAESIRTIPVGNGAFGLQAVDVNSTEQVSIVPDFPLNEDGYAEVDVKQLTDLLENKAFTLVNVHIPYEGEIPQTDLFIPFNSIESNLSSLPERDEPIVIYCRSGGMSTVAAEVLVRLGYTNVIEVDGGFNAWQAAGYELKISSDE